MRDTETTDTIESDDLAEMGDVDDESRRSFMKKGAMVTGAAALGLTGAAGSAAAQSSSPNVLVYSYDYYPNADFRVIANLQQSTTVRALKRRNGQTVPEIQLPSDYNGYIINYRIGGGDNVAGIQTFLFSRQSLSVGSTYRLQGDAQVFTSSLNLLQVSANRR